MATPKFLLSSFFTESLRLELVPPASADMIVTGVAAAPRSFTHAIPLGIDGDDP
jgi:hypothetical protein